VISGILRHAQKRALGRLLNEDGTPNEDIIRKYSASNFCSYWLEHHFNFHEPCINFICRLFHKIDMDESRSLSRSELHALIVGINFDEVDFDKEDAVDKVMDDFDTSRNEVVDEEEFVQGMKKWLDEAKRSMPISGALSKKFIDDFHAVICSPWSLHVL
jgi:hypothetical protein